MLPGCFSSYKTVIRRSCTKKYSKFGYGALEWIETKATVVCYRTPTLNARELDKVEIWKSSSAYSFVTFERHLITDDKKSEDWQKKVMKMNERGLEV